MSTVAAIETQELIKDFAVGLRGVKLRAVDRLSLRVEPGQIFGLLGPNGSGKSTTIKIALGLLVPTAGTCTLFGVPSGQVEARCDVGYMPESPYFYRHLSGRELVSFYGQLCGWHGGRLRERVDEVIGWVGLAEAANRRVGTYSKGMLQRIGLAQAIVHDPRLVILDEPTAGVDPLGIAEFASLIRQLKARGKTVVIVSHLLEQVAELCDRVVMLDRGRAIFDSAAAEPADDMERMTLQLDRLTPPELRELQEWLVARGRAPARVGLSRMRLEEIFVRQVKAARDRGRA